MWTVVFVSPDKQKIDKLLTVLEDRKILTMLKAAGEDDFGEGTGYEILVPQTELETAQEIIFDIEINGK